MRIVDAAALIHATQTDVQSKTMSVKLLYGDISQPVDKVTAKTIFFEGLQRLAESLDSETTTADGQWTVKGFIDLFRRIYTISTDTKVVSKVIEIHLYPKFVAFAEENKFDLVVASHQNYYPDVTFVSRSDSALKFAVDFKSTYRRADNPAYCNGFTLGSHGEYFKNRASTKNIQFPYRDYVGHFCLGVIYSRLEDAADPDVKIYSLEDLAEITSVIGDLKFFVQEKWRIASDKPGSGNTANIGSVKRIEDIVRGNGMFSRLGESWFDDYWTNYGKIRAKAPSGEMKPIQSLEAFVRYRGGDVSRIVPKTTPSARKGK